MESITLQYYNDTEWVSFVFYATKIIQAPNINKISGESSSGELYQHSLSKRYNYNVNLLLSDVAPYLTTLDAQITFLYNFFAANQQKMGAIDIVCENNGVIQLNLIENSKYIRTINLTLNEKHNKSGAF